MAFNSFFCFLCCKQLNELLCFITQMSLCLTIRMYNLLFRIICCSYENWHVWMIWSRRLSGTNLLHGNHGVFYFSKIIQILYLQLTHSQKLLFNEICVKTRFLASFHVHYIIYTLDKYHKRFFQFYIAWVFNENIISKDKSWFVKMKNLFFQKIWWV